MLQCKFSTIANYLNGLVNITQYCYSGLDSNDPLLAVEVNPLTQLINLRAQAEKAAKQQNMYEKRIGGWLAWPQVQEARVAAMAKLAALPAGETAAKRNLLRDCAAIALLSLIPPDRCVGQPCDSPAQPACENPKSLRRVGCIRKLRLSQTLKRKPGGGFSIDLSKPRDGHSEMAQPRTHTSPRKASRL